MELTMVQRRTLEVLQRPPPPPGADDDVTELREDLEARLRAIPLQGPLWLSKSRLNERARCEGSYAADLGGEKGPFSYGFKTAVGAIVHRAVQADVASEREADPRSVVEFALARQLSDVRLLGHWAGLQELERHELLAESTRQLVMFREMFPPLDRGFQPLSELSLQVRLLGGKVVLLGRPDLVLGRPPAMAVDLKTGDPRPEHAEDGRYYALLLTMMFHRRATLSATAYVDSLELQPEVVEPRMLERAADRVVDAVAFASDVPDARHLRLNPGPYCSWCPRSAVCPVSTAREPADLPA